MFRAMKKYLIIASAAILALASCAKEQSIPTPVKEETILLNFVSERPQLASETTPSNAPTRTQWSTNKIVWSTGDKIRVGYKKDGSWMGQSEPGTAKFYKSGEVTIDGGNASVGTFSVPISGSAFSDPAVSGTYQFFAVCPGDAISGAEVADPTAKNITLPATQTPGSNTFDPTADILVGQTEGLSINGLPTDPIELSWTRLVAHADLTFSNLAYSGSESVSKITLTFNTEAKVAGSFAVNIPAATAGEGSTNILVLSGSNITSGADYAKAWACVLPVTFTSLNVELKTDKAVYTREITSISKSFKQNARNTLEINMSTATRTPITELIADGNYVIAALSSATYYAISSDANGTRRARVEITTDGFNPKNYSEVSPYTAANNLVWTVTNVSGGIKINQATDPSSYMAYTGNGINLNSTGSLITVEEGSSTGTYNLSSTSYLWMNGNYGFGFYANSQTTKDLYFIPATGTPTLKFPVTSTTVSAATTSVEFSYTTEFIDGNPNVSVTSDEGNAVADIAISAGTLNVTLNENATTSDKSITLTVSAAGAANVILSITQSGAVAPASAGDPLWSEDFSDVTVASGKSIEGNTSCNINNVYGKALVSYAYSDNGTNKTLVYGQNSAGGTSPELLIGKKADAGATVWGIFTASGIPTSGFGTLTLSYIANGDITFTSTTPGISFGDISSDGNSRTVVITNANTADYINISFENQTTGNVRIDDIVLAAGAPVPGITVATSAATATASVAGTTATLNGSLTLVNGAVNANVTSAGFYYKVNGSGGAYTKVTCASAPTSTTSFSYDLTGLTKGTTYTYYAWAVYNSGSEVTGEATEKTFTPTQSDGSTTVAVTISSYASSHSWSTGTQYTSVSVDEYITARKEGTGSNSGKYYTTSPAGWRFYQSENSTCTFVISASGGHTIESVTVDYNSKSDGTLVHSSSNIASGTKVDVNASSISFTVDRTSSGTGAQVAISKITVKYN